MREAIKWMRTQLIVLIALPISPGKTRGPAKMIETATFVRAKVAV
jgi:hypothetical protein